MPSSAVKLDTPLVLRPRHIPAPGEKWRTRGRSLLRRRVGEIGEGAETAIARTCGISTRALRSLINGSAECPSARTLVILELRFAIPGIAWFQDPPSTGSPLPPKPAKVGE